MDIETKRRLMELEQKVISLERLIESMRHAAPPIPPASGTILVILDEDHNLGETKDIPTYKDGGSPGSEIATGRKKKVLNGYTNLKAGTRARIEPIAGQDYYEYYVASCGPLEIEEEEDPPPEDP